MYAGRDFSSADAQESEPFVFDFVNDLDSGETVASAVWSIDVATGTDAAAAARLVGSPAVSSTKTSQLVAGLQDGVRYRLEAVVTTSAGYQRKLHSFVDGVSV